MPRMFYKESHVDVAEGCVDTMLNRGWELEIDSQLIFEDEEPTVEEIDDGES